MNAPAHRRHKHSLHVWPHTFALGVLPVQGFSQQFLFPQPSKLSPKVSTFYWVLGHFPESLLFLVSLDMSFLPLNQPMSVASLQKSWTLEMSTHSEW